MMDALFATSEIPPPSPRDHAKRRTGRDKDKARLRKKEHREMDAARRASLADEEALRMRVVESAAGASSSRKMEIPGGKADSVLDVRTLEGVQITGIVVQGTGHTSLLIVGALRPSFSSSTTLVFKFFMHWGQFHVFLLRVG